MNKLSETNQHRLFLFAYRFAKLKAIIRSEQLTHGELKSIYRELKYIESIKL